MNESSHFYVDGDFVVYQRAPKDGSAFLPVPIIEYLIKNAPAKDDVLAEIAFTLNRSRCGR